MWNKGKINHTGTCLKKKKKDVAQDVEQPQFVEKPHTVKQPELAEEPKDVEQATRGGTKERSTILAPASCLRQKKKVSRKTWNNRILWTNHTL